MFKIPQQKVDDLSMNIKEMLRYGGMAMTCLSELMRENGMDAQYREPQYRESMNYRYPQHAMYRDDDDEWREPEYRRGVKGTGRYSMYR